MFVLRFTRECPDLMMENFYDEVVTVRNGIALVVNEHVKNSLLVESGYEYVGEIKEEKELKEALENKKKSDLRLELQTQVVDLDELAEIFKAKEANKVIKPEFVPLIDRID